MNDTEEMNMIDSEQKRMELKIKALEEEVENVSGLLAETLSSIKESKAQENMASVRPFPPPEGRVAGMVMSRLGSFSRRHRRVSETRDSPPETNSDGGEAGELQQLKKIRQVYQFIILKQRKEMSVKQKILVDAVSKMDRMAEDANVDKIKISALEDQFIVLNDAKENDGDLNSSFMANCSEGSTSIIQIDAAYLSTLENTSRDNSIIIHELKTKVEEEQADNQVLREKMALEKDLHDQITALNIKVEARDATILAMDRSYKLQIHKSTQHNLHQKAITTSYVSSSNFIRGEDYSYTSDTESSDEETEENNELRTQLASRDAIISKLQSRISVLERRSKDPTTGAGRRKQTILSIQKVNLLSEILHTSCSRLSSLLNRVEVAKNTDMNMPFVFSLCDKFAIMQDYIKLSLHLLQTKLSNELESIKLGRISGVEEDDETIQLRFDRTMESLNASDKKNEDLLEELKADIDHQNIKTAAKDGVIEDLMKSEKSTNIVVSSLRSELEIIKSMKNFSSVDAGLIVKFTECTKLEREMRGKEKTIERLNNVIDGYRSQENIASAAI